jgi:hypothetical protein
VEAEVGPIKYIAALVYGDNTDSNVLEKSVRWVIILIVSVFDPLALTLLLAATKALEWERGVDLFAPKKKEEEFTEEEIKELEELNKPEEPIKDQHTHIPVEEYYRELKTTPTDNVILTELAQDPMIVPEEPVDPLAHIVVPEIDRNEDPLHHMAKVMWHAANPDDDHRAHHALHQAGEIDRLPWQTEEHINSLAISDGEKKQLISRFANMPPPVPTKFVEVDPLRLEPDNVPTGSAGEVKGFGTQFPANSNKGDMFLRVDRLPSVLYKFNGTSWIEVDKSLTDSHAYDQAYIDHLISKIDSGEYDPDLLSDAERTSIETRLNQI